MATVHFIQQGKGGVGKSMLASILYQFLKHFDKYVFALDTDPVNSTLTGFKEFNVQTINIMDGDNINARAFDDIIESIANAEEDTHIVVDNGSSSFVALGSYMKENDIYKLLTAELGHKVFFHVVVTGGQAMLDTVKGLKVVALDYSKAPIIVWLNPFFGDISLDNKPFEEFQVYLDHAEQFHSVIKLPMGNRNTIGKDIEDLFAKRMSFDAGINGSGTLMVRSRLRQYWQTLTLLIEKANFI